MEVLNKIKAEMAAFEERRKQLVAELQKDFPSIFKPLFEKSKRINSIGWRQYTPYFNDGDECVFGVNNDDLYINGEDEYDLEGQWTRMTIGYNPAVANPNFDKEESEIYNEFKNALTSIDDSFYKDLFGDHVSVTINRDGTIETEEYDHD